MKNNKKIAAFSDWHDQGVSHGNFRTITAGEVQDGPVKFPEADVLLFAGDVTFAAPTNYRLQEKQMRAFIDKLVKHSDKYEFIVATLGNHDTAWDESHHIINERELVNHIHFIRRLNEMVSDANKRSKKAKIIIDNGIHLHELEFSDGDVLKVMTSPYSSKIWNSDPWGFHYFDGYFERDWEGFKGCDIFVTHSPIKGHGDRLAHEPYQYVGTTLFDGEEDKPKYVVSGHIHEGHGVTEGYKGTEWEGTTFISCAHLNVEYEPVQDFIVFEVEGLDK